MLALAKLHFKTNKRASVFIIFAILGILISLIVTTSVTFSTNIDGGAQSDYGQYGFQWTFLTVLACLGAVSLSMNTMERHRKSSLRELISLHGLDHKNQYRGLALGNIALSLAMALVLALGLAISLLVKRPAFSIPGFILALGTYLMATSTMALIMSCLGLVLPAVATGLFGVLLTVLGSLRGILEIVVKNKGGLFGQIGGGLLKVLPPIDDFGRLARDLFFGDFSSWDLAFENAAYVWIIIGIFLILSWGVAKYER